MISWKNYRLRLLQRRHPLRCQICGTFEKVNFHHVLSRSEYPELECEDSNVVELCRRHHFIVGHLGNWSIFNPNFWRDFENMRRVHNHKNQHHGKV